MDNMRLTLNKHADDHPAMRDPWFAAADWVDKGVTSAVFAVLIATHGPAYRRPGAAMAIGPDGRFAGSITSGCVEADLILRAAEVSQTGLTQRLRYGEGSPFFDLRLPCGGGIEVQLFRVRDAAALRYLAGARASREAVSLRISPCGRLRLLPWQATGPDVGGEFRLGFRPALRFLIFGTGAEAAAFTGLVRGLGYHHLFLSHEESSLTPIHAAGSPTRLVTRLQQLHDVRADADTAVILFYHDHDFEPEILRHFTRDPVLYLGAQGSQATQTRRLVRMAEMGLSAAEISRIRGPIGMIPSSRDPKTLAVSVLAEILDVYGDAQDR